MRSVHDIMTPLREIPPNPPLQRGEGEIWTRAREWQCPNVVWSNLAVGVFSTEAAVVEYDLAALDVIAKAEATQAESVLTAFSWRDSAEFDDVVLAAQVVRVGAENIEGLGIDAGEFWMLPVESPEEAIEAFPRLRSCSSRRSSSAGRLLPARYSSRPFAMIARILGSWISR